jgi:hypothetical protein
MLDNVLSKISKLSINSHGSVVNIPLNPRSMQKLNGPFLDFKISARDAKEP